MKGDPAELGFSTRAIHVGQAPDPTTGSVTKPIYATSTYVHDELGKHKGYEYARVQNPTREALEDNLASLEGGLSGHAFSAGMSAVSTLMTMFESGDHIIASDTVYGGVYRFFTQILSRYGLEFSWVDTTNLDNIGEAVRERTRMVYIETPTNPLMGVTDIAGAADIAHAHDAILAVDNTFMSPYYQRPLELGADVIMHSTTKFINGHSDLLGGALIAAEPEHAEWFAFVQKSVGAVMSAFDCFLVLRGLKTLAVRMERHETSTQQIIPFLTSHPKILRVLYPGLPDHPGHEVHKRQATGFGALVTVDLGDYASAKWFLDRLELLSLAESLGGVETLISHPASMTHASVPPEERERIGLTDGLVRLSVGLEDPDDLIADMEQALG